MSSNGSAPTEHLDVLVVGAGISGIAAGYHLQDKCPDRSFAILEARDTLGGTWDLFRYPGIRSDSAMFTLGYPFRPWRSTEAIAEGSQILQYLRDTATEFGIDRKIRFGHRVVGAEWSTDEQRWLVEVEVAASGERFQLTCGFLFFCTGYYRYDEGFTPEFPGIDRFGGEVIHPQHWPRDLDYSGKRVVVIGSGATAVTLVPAMADEAGHVTMLQRSPSYVASLPKVDPLAKIFGRVLPRRVLYSLLRWKDVAITTGSYVVFRRWPKLGKAYFRWATRLQLPPDVPTDPHFRPRYNPWEQRVCAVPNGDIFRALRRHTVSIVTDTIETFTENGIKLSSGDELEADIVVTATGLNLLALGGSELAVDGELVNLPDKMGYKGMMLSDVPNMAVALGYTNASWTLKTDLTCEYVCRLLNRMAERGYTQVTPRNNDPSVVPEPFIDFNAGYVLRSIDQFPKQGSKKPWRLNMNYARDVLLIRHGKIDDGALEFSRTRIEERPRATAAAA